MSTDPGLKFGCQTVTATQSVQDFESAIARSRKTAAFEEWRLRLKRGDRLPRGRYFKNKTPGLRFHVVRDEFWLMAGRKGRTDG